MLILTIMLSAILLAQNPEPTADEPLIYQNQKGEHCIDYRDGAGPHCHPGNAHRRRSGVAPVGQRSRAWYSHGARQKRNGCGCRARVVRVVV